LAAASAAESIPGVASHTLTVEASDGTRLEAIIAQAETAQGPLNPLLFTQWVSCGSLEYREGSNSRELLASLARESGLALVRVERDALDGTGPACADLDYNTELKHYVEAFTELLGNEQLDPSRVYLYGSSLGSTMAPLVARELQARGFDIAGIMVQGGGGVTYFERMLTFERHYLERRPDDVVPAAIHDEFLLRTHFQYEYLVGGRHPDDIAGDSPAMARIRSDILGLGESDQYGRPYAWHQQAAKHNFLAAWAEIDAPVLVIFNEFDQYEGRHGHKVIVDTVNRLRPGTATFIERPCIGHSDNRFATIEDAYAGRDGTPAWQDAAEIMTSWLREQT
jgi:pimeloyl-ACP methyl ester carboxylesterase